MKDALERLAIVKDLFSFLWQNKSWWIIPIVFVLIVLSILLIITGGSAITPFIYVLF
jgi:hypothetical protein